MRINKKNINNCVTAALISIDHLDTASPESILGEGTDGIAYKIETKKCKLAVIKKYKPNPSNKINRIHRIINETKISLLVRNLIIKNICPNFIYMYHSTITHKIKNNFLNNDNMFILLEYCDTDLKKFLDGPLMLTKVYDSIIFQILIAIYAFQTYYTGIHYDLAPNNIFIKYINKNIVNNYNINGIDFYVPTYGYLVLMADFGFAYTEKTHPNKIDKIKEKIARNEDYKYLRDIYKAIIKKWLFDKKGLYTSNDYLNLIDPRYYNDIIYNIADQLN